MKIRKNGKTITLTESDLRRIVKRVITEQPKGQKKSRNWITKYKGKSSSIYIYDALTDRIDDNEGLVLHAVKYIKDCAGLKKCNINIKKLSGKDLLTFINSEMSSVDEEYDQIIKHISNIAFSCF